MDSRREILYVRKKFIIHADIFECYASQVEMTESKKIFREKNLINVCFLVNCYISKLALNW